MGRSLQAVLHLYKPEPREAYRDAPQERSERRRACLTLPPPHARHASIDTACISQYLLRVEAIGLQVPGYPQWYISCAQITVIGGGSANPRKVSIPGYVSESDP